MTPVSALAQYTAGIVAIADRPGELKRFLQLGCAAAIWRRQPEPAFQDWIDTLYPSTLPQGRLVLRPDRVASAVTTLCDVAETPALGLFHRSPPIEGTGETRLVLVLDHADSPEEEI